MPRTNDVSNVELIYSGKSDGGSSSLKVTTPLKLPVVDGYGSSIEMDRPNKMSRELYHELLGSDVDSICSFKSSVSAHSQSRAYDDGSGHR